VVARELRERATQADQLRCERIIEAWNKRPTHEWSPAIGRALTAGYRWLSVYCQQVAAVDLQSIDRHPLAAITTLILTLRCERCLAPGHCPSCAGSPTFRRILSPTAAAAACSPSPRPGPALASKANHQARCGSCYCSGSGKEWD
jgi:hypothetical protein